VARTSIIDVIALLGGPGLDDSSEETRDRFRAFLSQPKWSPDDLHAWLEECVELASRAQPEFYFALQDIVVSMGVHFGFEVEFGSYTGTAVPIPFDGKWQTLAGEEILIEVKSSPWPLGSTNQLGQYMDAYDATETDDTQRSYGIYAIGNGDFTGVIEQIKGGEYRNRIKVVSFRDLIRLFSLRNLLKQQMPLRRIHELMQNLMLPFESVNIGSILEIIQGVAVSSSVREDMDIIDPEPTSSREWRHSELCEFLKECQPNQVALLLALCSVPNCELPGEELVARMRCIAPSVPGLPRDQVISNKTIGGTRSGMSKREQQLGKDGILESRNGRYLIRPEYCEWVVDWLRDEGYLPLKGNFDARLQGIAQDRRTVSA